MNWIISLKTSLKRRNNLFLGLFYLLLLIPIKARSQVDSTSIFTTIAEEAYLDHQFDLAIEYYQKAFEFNIHKNSLLAGDKIRIGEIIEPLIFLLKEKGYCDQVRHYFQVLLEEKIWKYQAARSIKVLLECHTKAGTSVDSMLKKKILTYFSLGRIRPDLERVLKSYLNIRKHEEVLHHKHQQFFTLIEEGLMPTIDALEAEHEQQQRAFRGGVFALLTLIVLVAILIILRLQNLRTKYENKALLEGKISESDRLSRDLHDSLGLKIVFLKQQIEQLDAGSIHPNDRAILSQQADNIYHAMHSVVASNITPPALMLGLAPALESLVHQINQVDQATNFNLYPYNLDKRFNEEQEKHIFYIVRELLNNVIKHAQASQVSIEVTRIKNKLIAIVQDDGIGYIPSPDTLKTVKSRVNLMKGKLKEDSQPGYGTCIVIEISLLFSTKQLMSFPRKYSKEME